MFLSLYSTRIKKVHFAFDSLIDLCLYSMNRLTKNLALINQYSTNFTVQSICEVNHKSIVETCVWHFNFLSRLKFSLHLMQRQARMNAPHVDNISIRCSLWLFYFYFHSFRVPSSVQMARFSRETLSNNFKLYSNHGRNCVCVFLCVSDICD